jgi:signal transduction histidine kinase
VTWKGAALQTITITAILYLNYKRILSEKRLRVDRETQLWRQSEMTATAIQLLSHNLRESLTLIMGYSDLALPTNSKELVQIRDAVTQAGIHLQELSAIARIQTGDMK